MFKFEFYLNHFIAKNEVVHLVLPLFTSFYLAFTSFLTSLEVMLVQLGKTGLGAPTRYACTGWDTSPASLAPLALLVLTVLLYIT